MPRNTPHLAIRALTGAVLPVLLVAGCSFGSGSGTKDSDSASDAGPSKEAAPSPEPVKFSTLPDACETVSKDTVKKTVPKAKPASGKSLGSKDADAYSGCLWSGVDLSTFEYRELSVSLRRYDSDVAIGSGDKRATEYAQDKIAAISGNKEAKSVKDAKLSGVGDTATAISYDITKKDGKKSQDYREQRIVVRTANVVVTVDYSGAGLEDAKTPSAADIRKGAEKAAKEAVASLRA
ncbi:DUF3558 domain-containing protein [Streptomyces gobiensis]|uniref:DUF3558 domain-containing protein n=1 Tax=Streptomyces gobiensis TaxID=2875706 RepID=UPI001E3EC1C1|nr:DUF3558 domain-containing protein [Streptomyces gobiensis]UGY92916.1 DUF3558 domain-containing protein [Streptomyces gobiensis]